eukprot:GHVU01004964.1.p1 GENE.GHVU01004964.1~~GHVU01004964.1.p1  ORF type:complete len:382 (+),score=108.44 GHVU01004964.1:191-1336(+)
MKKSDTAESVSVGEFGRSFTAFSLSNVGDEEAINAPVEEPDALKKRHAKAVKALKAARACVCGNPRDLTRLRNTIRTDLDKLKGAPAKITAITEKTKEMEEQTFTLRDALKLRDDLANMDDSVMGLEKKRGKTDNLRTLVETRKKGLERDKAQFDGEKKELEDLKRWLPNAEECVEEIKGETEIKYREANAAALSRDQIKAKVEKRLSKKDTSSKDMDDFEKMIKDFDDRTQSAHSQLIKSAEIDKTRRSEVQNMREKREIIATELNEMQQRVVSRQNELEAEAKEFAEKEKKLEADFLELQRREKEVQARQKALYAEDLEEELDMQQAALQAQEDALELKMKFVKSEVERMLCHMSAKKESVEELEKVVASLKMMPSAGA